MKVNLKLYHDDDGCENVSFSFLEYTELEEGDWDNADDDMYDNEEETELSSHYEFVGFVRELAKHPEYEIVYTIDVYNGCCYYRRIVTRVNPAAQDRA